MVDAFSLCPVFSAPAMKATAFTAIIRGLTAGCVVGCSGALVAQEPEQVLDEPPLMEPAPAPALPRAPAPQIESITLFPDTTEDTAVLAEPVRKDRWSYVLHGSVRATFDSNIFISERHEEEDFYFTMAAGVAVGIGDFRSELFDFGRFEDRFQRDRSEAIRDQNFFFINYVPSITFFLDHTEENSFDHDLSLAGQWSFQKLTLGLRSRFQTQNVADIDLGERIERRLLSTALTSRYDYSGKTSFELNFYDHIRDYEQRVDTHEVRAQAWMNYQLQPKVLLGIGLAYGHVELSEGPSQDFEQVLVRARYRATEKLQLHATAGVEFRQIESGGGRESGGDETNSVFSLGGSYFPFDGTSILLHAYRQTQTSATASGINYTSTGIDLLIRQRFLQRYYFALAAGYQNAEYNAHGSGSETERSDDLFYLRPSVGLDLTKWLTMELAVEFRQNDSNVDRRSFAQTLAYFQLTVLF